MASRPVSAASVASRSAQRPLRPRGQPRPSWGTRCRRASACRRKRPPPCLRPEGRRRRERRPPIPHPPPRPCRLRPRPLRLRRWPRPPSVCRCRRCRRGSVLRRQVAGRRRPRASVLRRVRPRASVLRRVRPRVSVLRRVRPRVLASRLREARRRRPLAPRRCMRGLGRRCPRCPSSRRARLQAVLRSVSRRSLMVSRRPRPTGPPRIRTRQPRRTRMRRLPRRPLLRRPVGASPDSPGACPRRLPARSSASRSR
jgi:hypothetical protein